MRFEVVVLPVADVDRAKSFYKALGWREDLDVSGEGDIRVVQMTPPRSDCSIMFGRGLTSAAPGSMQGLYLAVNDIEAARAELVGRGAEVSEVFPDAGGGMPRANLKDGSLGWHRTGRATSRSPRSTTRTATAGSSKRSPSAFPAGCGECWTNTFLAEEEYSNAGDL
ncbi:VOC family protein [Micromonospora rhizosphaerae]|nr:VOC family protein [Micromonospora rhizosphaerae]